MRGIICGALVVLTITTAGAAGGQPVGAPDDLISAYNTCVTDNFMTMQVFLATGAHSIKQKANAGTCSMRLTTLPNPRVGRAPLC